MPNWNFAVLVDAIAREVPEREALVDGARRFTWAQLDARSRALAWHLHAEGGVAPGDRVVVALRNGAEYVESYVAVRKARAVPLNVDARSSADALHKVIDAADAKVIVCTAASADDARLAARQIPKRWRPLVVELGPAYEQAIATSDPPDEWEIEQPNADDLIFLANRGVGGSARPTTVLAAAPLAQGNGLATALGALSAGGRVVFVDSARFDPRLVWRTVAIEHVEVLTIGGDAYAGRLVAALPDALAEHDLTSLRTISSSGAALSTEVAHALEAALGDVTIVDAYDGTESRSPTGAPKVRPSDVEARLLKHKSISDCAIVGVADPRIGRKVVAIVQVADGHYLDTAELSAWCRAHLPSTLTPGTFLFVDVIDRLPSGVADTDALRQVAVELLLDAT